MVMISIVECKAIQYFNGTSLDADLHVTYIA